MTTLRARRTRPSRLPHSEPLESRRLLATTPDLLLVGYDRSINKPVIREYTRSGALVNTVVVEQPARPYPTLPLDVAVAPDGKWQVFNGSTSSNGPITPSLSTYDPATRTWAHHAAPGWTAPYFQDEGGVAVAGQYVFVSDRMNDPGEPSGLIRFDAANGYAPQRFADGATYGDVTLGLDGLLYGVGTPTSSASGSAIRVFDPQTLELVRSVGLPYTIKGVAADAAGEIYAQEDRGLLIHADRDGTILETRQLNPTFPFRDRGEIDIAADGTLMLPVAGEFQGQDRGGVYLYDTSLNGVGGFDLPAGYGEPRISLGFAAWAAPLVPAADVRYVNVSDYPRFIRASNAGAFTVTVTDTRGNTLTDYRGTVRFTSTDPAAALPADYTFTAADAGRRTFAAAFTTPGTHRLTATDAAGGWRGTQYDVVVHGGDPARIPMEFQRDLVFDPRRNRLYVLSRGNRIERYDLASQTLLDPVVIQADTPGGAQLVSGDITADGQYLYVTDINYFGAAQARLFKVDLDTLEVKAIPFDVSEGIREAGAVDIAIAANGKALVTTGLAGSGHVPLRELDTATDTVTVRRDLPGRVGGSVTDNSGLARPADRSYLLIVQTGTGAPTFYYEPEADAFTGGTEDSVLAPPVMNADGSLMAVAGVVQDKAGDVVHRFPGIVDAMVFDPRRDVLYGFTSEAGVGTLNAWDTDDWSLLWSRPAGRIVGAGGFYLGTDATEISADGRWMFVSVGDDDSPGNTEGVYVYDLAGPLEARADAASKSQGEVRQVTVTARDPAGAIDAGFTDTVRFASTDPFAELPPDYTFTAADRGVKTFPLTLKSPGDQTVTVTDSLGRRVTLPLAVQNRAPVVPGPGPQPAAEGATAAFDLGRFADGSAGDGPWAVSVQWGDGTRDEFSVATAGNLPSRPHRYADSGRFAATLTVTDRHGLGASAPFAVDVGNVAPTATFTADAPVPLGSAATVRFTGAADPSPADAEALRYSYDFDDDGTFEIANATSASAAVPASFLASAGTHRVRGRVADQDGGATDYHADVIVQPAPAQVAIAAAADAYVRDGSSASANFGAAPRLEVKQGPEGLNRETYLRFDLSRLGPGALESATLRLFGRLSDAAASGIPVAVYGVADVTWGEAAIHWNNKPATSGGALAAATVAGTAGQWYELDVSEYLRRQKAAGASAVTFVLKATARSSPRALFDSREAASADTRPQLLVRTAAPASTVVGRHVFYNHSGFDGSDAAATGADDAAVATDKAALLPGQAASFANVTSYVRGINGVMVDVAGLPAGPVSAADFGFEVSAGPAPLTWTTAPPAASVSVRRGAGVNGSDRVTVTWADGAILNRWLRVTVKASDQTALAAPDVFCFGNLAGDSGDSTTTLRVNATDVAAVKRGLGGANLTVASLLDFDRDGRVNATDLAAVKAHLTRTLPPAPPVTAPAMEQVLSSATDLVAGARHELSRKFAVRLPEI